MQNLLTSIVEKNRVWTKEGKVATYIPELGKADPSVLGISIIDKQGNLYTSGDYQYKFTLQSITKVITLMVALLDNGIEEVFRHVGMEPTGDPFNSIAKLETIRPAKPFNPMINAGAIATVSLVKGSSKEERLNKIINLIKKMTRTQDIDINQRVYESEYNTGDLNRALAFFMKNYGIIKGEVEDHLEIYFKQCSIEVTSIDIARMGMVLANEGKDLTSGEQVIPADIVRIANTFMVTTGMYNASGEFAINVGIPAKSGVGGGIMAAVPKQFGIGVIGPALDDKGNSIAGVKVLEDLSRELNLSIF